MTLHGLANIIRRWSKETFGDRGPVGPLRHLKKECDEAIAAPKDITEYADLLILLVDATWRAGFTITDLLSAADAKTVVNKGRQWPEPSPDEPVEHERC